MPGFGNRATRTSIITARFRAAYISLALNPRVVRAPFWKSEPVATAFDFSTEVNPRVASCVTFASECEVLREVSL